MRRDYIDIDARLRFQKIALNFNWMKFTVNGMVSLFLFLHFKIQEIVNVIKNIL